MPWADLLVALGTAGLLVFALAMLCDKATHVSRLSSAAFTTFIACIAVGLYANSMMFGAAVNAADAAVWAMLFVFRGAQTKGE